MLWRKRPPMTQAHASWTSLTPLSLITWLAMPTAITMKAFKMMKALACLFFLIMPKGIAGLCCWCLCERVHSLGYCAGHLSNTHTAINQLVGMKCILQFMVSKVCWLHCFWACDEAESSHLGAHLEQSCWPLGIWETEQQEKGQGPKIPIKNACQWPDFLLLDPTYWRLLYLSTMLQLATSALDEPGDCGGRTWDQNYPGLSFFIALHWGLSCNKSLWAAEIFKG